MSNSSNKNPDLTNSSRNISRSPTINHRQLPRYNPNGRSSRSSPTSSTISPTSSTSSSTISPTSSRSSSRSSSAGVSSSSAWGWVSKDGAEGRREVRYVIRARFRTTARAVARSGSR